ncbi:MAG: hypothetical protein ACJ72N_01340 [Labedaea sp.]
MNPRAADGNRGPPLRLDRIPASFRVRETIIEAGADHPYQPADWHDALVVVRCGTLEVEFRGGGRRRFDTGDVLWLAGLPVFTLHNPGQDAAVLIAVSRP